MSVLGRVLIAEAIKLRRSTAMMVALVGPLVGSAIVALVLFSQSAETFSRAGPEPWGWLGLLTLHTWCLLLMPLFVGLESALVATLEHRGGNWKHMLALPVPRSTIFVAKQVGLGGLVAISLVSLSVGTGIVGLVASLLRPEFDLGAPLPLLRWCRFLVLIFVAGWLAMALQNWIALRSSSFAVPIGASVVATGVMLALGQVDQGEPWALFPWYLPVQVATRFIDGEIDPLWIAVGGGGGLLVCWLSAVDLRRRDVP